MATTTRKPGEGPRPDDLRPEQLQQIGHVGQVQGLGPSFVPPGIARRRGQIASRPVGASPTIGPAVPLSARLAESRLPAIGAGQSQRLPQHTPRALARQLDSRQAGKAPGAFYGGTTVAAQWSVNAASDVWFYDSQVGWQMLDGSSESGLEAMNAVLSLAREQQSTTYYDTNDQTGEVVEVYVF